MNIDEAIAKIQAMRVTMGDINAMSKEMAIQDIARRDEPMWLVWAMSGAQCVHLEQLERELKRAIREITS